jgi:hypothetical protein
MCTSSMEMGSEECGWDQACLPCWESDAVGTGQPHAADGVSCDQDGTESSTLQAVTELGSRGATSHAWVVGCGWGHACLWCRESCAVGHRLSAAEGGVENNSSGKGPSSSSRGRHMCDQQRMRSTATNVTSKQVMPAWGMHHPAQV